MRILVGWDNAAELDLMTLCLNVAENQVAMTTDPEEFLEHVKNERWDVVLMTVNMPDVDKGYEIFQRIRKLQPECPVVGACQQQDVCRVARFMTNGMRSFVLRDAGGDYVFLLYSTLENVVEAIRAEREQKLAERLREEIDSVRKLQESIIARRLRRFI